MKRFPYLSLALALALSCGGIGAAAQPKKPKPPKLTNAQKRIWTRTDGVVTSTVPPIDLSTGQTAAGHAASTFVSGVKTSALSDSIPNMGCPVQQIPLNTETVVAQGTASAPAGTNVNWEFTPSGSVAIQIGGQRHGLFNAYIGAANPNCVDFDSCKTTLTPVLIANVSEGLFDTFVPFVLDAPNLAPTDTAVFFITLTTSPTTLPPPAGDSWCSNAMFVPLAHSITPQ
jgi:hypothetical protein